ncbi:MAG: glycosyltransferase [Kaiparowitsia implicata GSE-PSE-MK54-09C]|jgi:glycosyltransferase involved in cell wall biosynthesis|nr:glycosyltransferase [Kaiparowitsia implicata GSE-PSE-MK54-09C]
MQIMASPAYSRENPYIESLYGSIRELGHTVDHFSVAGVVRGQYAVWHFHWPERTLNDPHWLRAIAKTVIMLLLMAIARLRGIQTVWTVHNLGSHERFYPQLESWFWAVFTRQLSGYISLSQVGLDVAQKRFPAIAHLPGFVVPHAHYRGEYPDTLTREQARQYLNIPDDDSVALLIGRLRRYKNAPQLIHSFRQLPDTHSRLYIVGSPEFEDIRAEIEAAAAADARVQLHLDFIPPDKMQLYLRAADLVVLPYREILNSGSAVLALSFDCPVLVPMAGSLGELQRVAGADWVHTYTDDLTPTALAHAMDWARHAPRAQSPPLDPLNQGAIAQQTLEAYGAIVSR